MHKLFVKRNGRYHPAAQSQIAEAHLSYCADSLPGLTIGSPADSRSYLIDALQGHEAEKFCVLMLDNRHRVIAFRVMFTGTIDAAAVYPREIVKACLLENAAAVILAHNHPSGVAEPSQSDQLITRRIRDALELVDVRLLDHFVIGGNRQCVSLASRGMI